MSILAVLPLSVNEAPHPPGQADPPDEQPTTDETTDIRCSDLIKLFDLGTRLGDELGFMRGKVAAHLEGNPARKNTHLRVVDREAPAAPKLPPAAQSKIRSDLIESIGEIYRLADEAGIQLIVDQDCVPFGYVEEARS